MQQDAINVSTKAIETYSIEKDIACYIKKEFDRKHNPTWHCVVGNILNLILREKLWFIRYSRNKTLYILLSWTNCSFAIQVWISYIK